VVEAASAASTSSPCPPLRHLRTDSGSVPFGQPHRLHLRPHPYRRTILLPLLGSQAQLRIPNPLRRRLSEQAGSRRSWAGKGCVNGRRRRRKARRWSFRGTRFGRDDRFGRKEGRAYEREKGGSRRSGKQKRSLKRRCSSEKGSSRLKTTWTMWRVGVGGCRLAAAGCFGAS
jgi:hypothetical protein